MKFSWHEKLGFGLLVAAWVVWGSHQIGGLLVHAKTLDKPAYMVEIAATAPTQVKAANIEQDDVMKLLASASEERGGKVFKKCKSCHSVNKGGKNAVGPNLWDIVGRPTGSVAGFNYSGAFKKLDENWSYANLGAFLLNPKSYAKGTKMSFSGLKKAEDRAAIISYLRSLSDSPKPLP